MDIKKEKELVLNLVWKVFLGTFIVLSLGNTYYFGLIDTITVIDKVFGIALPLVPLVIGIGLFLCGLYHAVSVFLKDIQNHINNEPFVGYFWRPLALSIFEFLSGFGAVFLFSALLISLNASTETVSVSLIVINLCTALVPQLYVWAYVFSVVLACVLLLHKKIV